MGEKQHQIVNLGEIAVPRQSNPALSSSSSTPFRSSENKEAQPPKIRCSSAKRLTKQCSIREIPRDIAWEKRRRQSLLLERRRKGVNRETEILTDEDLNELKGCIELGFGFNEEAGQKLCSTIPALDLYFAINRQFSISPIVSPTSNSPKSGMGFVSPICSPGDDPRHVKMKLRHWAQAVACSVRQSS